MHETTYRNPFSPFFIHVILGLSAAYASERENRQDKEDFHVTGNKKGIGTIPEKSLTKEAAEQDHDQRYY